MKSTQTRKGEGESRAMRRVAPRFLERSAASLPFEASPNEFQRKLNVSGFTRAKNLTYGRIGYVSHGVGEVRLVKGVEELGSELHPEPFSKREIFEEGEVPILEARSIQNASSRVAKSRVTSKDLLSVRPYNIDRGLSKQAGAWIIGARVKGAVVSGPDSEAARVEPVFNRPFAGR